MPRPSTLPVVDWQSVFNSGKTWEAWLADAENPKQATQMQERFATLTLPEELKARLAAPLRPIHIVAIAEDWCGDVVRHAPVLARIAHHQPQIQVRFITRMDYPEVFVRFLTNGGEAIPKFIFLSDDWVECGNWGPMQSDCRLLISRGKACGNVSAARALVSSIYAEDSQCLAVFQELCELVELASAETVE